MSDVEKITRRLLAFLAGAFLVSLGLYGWRMWGFDGCGSTFCVVTGVLIAIVYADL